MSTREVHEQSHTVVTAARMLDVKFHAWAPLVDWIAGADQLSRFWEVVAQDARSNDIFDRILAALDISVTCAHEDLDRLPPAGPLVIVANHPHGLLDGLAIATVFLRRRRDFRFLANSMLAGIPRLEQYVIPVDVFNPAGGANRSAAREGIRWLRSGGALITFPAGEVSSLVGLPPVIADREWSEGPLRMAAATGAKIIQSFIHGGNGFTFHFAGFAHPALRMLLLGRELLNKRGRNVRVAFGKPISPDIAARPRANEYLRRRTWALGQTRESPTPRTRRLKPVAAAIDPFALERNIAHLSPDCLLFAKGAWSAYLASAQELPDVLKELGHLRELTFRQVGEGTGRPSDLDAFDSHYQHLLLWNSDTREIVGAYRIAAVDDVLTRFGLGGLYTRTLFRYGNDFLNRLTPGLELGRSFVRLEYQRHPQSLFYLWRGIGAVLARYHRFRFLFGPVSISSEYSRAARDLMARYFRSRCRAGEWAVRPRHPFRSVLSELADITPWLTDVDELGNAVSELEPDGKGLPVLLKQYLGLGAEVIEFNVDPQFSNALDALIVVDLTRCPRRTLTKYMGSEAALAYLAEFAK